MLEKGDESRAAIKSEKASRKKGSAGFLWWVGMWMWWRSRGVGEGEGDAEGWRTEGRWEVREGY